MGGPVIDVQDWAIHLIVPIIHPSVSRMTSRALNDFCVSASAANAQETTLNASSRDNIIGGLMLVVIASYSLSSAKDPRDSSVQEGKVESYSLYKPQSHHHAP